MKRRILVLLALVALVASTAYAGARLHAPSRPPVAESSNPIGDGWHDGQIVCGPIGCPVAE